MRFLMIFAIIFLFLATTKAVAGPIEATTKSGEKVLLFLDGTWRYKPVIKKRQKKLKATKPEKKEQLKRTPIRISGYVRLPYGRGVGNTIMKLYEVRDGHESFVKETKTTKKTGFYSFLLEGNWFGKRMRVAPPQNNRCYRPKKGFPFTINRNNITDQTRDTHFTNFLTTCEPWGHDW